MKSDIITAIKELNEKKGQEISLIDVSELTTISDYFVICTGTSSTQVKALADNVEFKLKNDHGLVPHHVEGHDSGSWVLLDYGSFVVNVFQDEARIFYNLEKHWMDGKRVDISDVLK